MKSRSDRLLGSWGEALTARWLYIQGYTILECNRCYREGELDIVARKGEILAVVEVKLRSGDFVSGSEAVTPRKQERVRKALGRYIADHPELDLLTIRFDVAQITAPQGTATEQPKLDYFENAFY